jgi:hypothetical protein
MMGFLTMINHKIDRVQAKVDEHSNIHSETLAFLRADIEERRSHQQIGSQTRQASYPDTSQQTQPTPMD